MIKAGQQITDENGNTITFNRDMYAFEPVAANYIIEVNGRAAVGGEIMIPSLMLAINKAIAGRLK